MTTTTGFSVLDNYSGGSFTETAYAPPGWAGALRVLVADYEDDDAYDLAGLASDGVTILSYDEAFEATPVAYSWTMPVQVLDVAVADWYGDGEDKICVLIPGGLVVYGSRGLVQTVIPLGSTEGYLVPFRQPSLLRRASCGGAQERRSVEGHRDG